MRSRWPWLVTAALAGALVLVLVLNVLAGDHAAPWWEVALGSLTVTVTGALGLLIALRVPGNRLAWLLLGEAAVLVSQGVAHGHARYALLETPGALPGAEWAVLWREVSWPLLFGVVVGVALLFPDGRLPSPRWRWVGMVAAATTLLALVIGSFDPEPFPAPFASVEKPLPAVEALAWLWPLLMLGGAVSLVAGVVAVRMRFRRAEGLERLQLKWLAYSAALVPFSFFVCLGAAFAGVTVDDTAAFTVLFFAMLTAVPASVGIAVLRYRLYEIDRVVNRTLVYGVLTLLLAGTYAAGALVLGAVLGSGSSWATAGATLIAAVAFAPLRARVQDVVDRRFNRARYDALRRINRYLEDLRDGRASPEAVEPMLRELLEDEGLELRFWLPASEIYVDARGVPAGDEPGPGQVCTPIMRAGAPVGLVLHRPVEEDRSRRLTEVVEAAGLAVEIARLGVELRRQLEEVAASRARIVAAGYEERRRLERDLHDGAQQRLISIGLALRHAQHGLGTQANGTGALLDGAVDELGRAVQELRDLANGIRPSQLDAGLGPALRQLAARAPLKVDVEVAPERFPPHIEAAAYFIASEALTNAVKHSGASRVRMAVRRENGELLLTVGDDGVGGAVPGEGSGLRGLADRVEAHAGALRLDSPPQRGTTVTARLPCAS